MKIHKIACPSCGYSFKIEKIDDRRTYECPSCKASFYIENEKAPVVNININHYDSETKQPASPSVNRNIGVIGFVFFAILIIVFGIINSIGASSVIEKASYTYRSTPNSEPMIKFVEQVYNKALDNITDQDYGKLSYILVVRDCPADDWTNASKYPWRFDYAFSVDEQGEPIDMQTIYIESEASVEQRDLQVFTNIVNANFGKYGEFIWDGVSYDSIDYQNLKKLQYYKGNSFGELLDAFNAPATINGLSVKYMRTSDEVGDGISIFSGLKHLTVEYIDNNSELAELAKLKTLESLNLERLDDDQKMDLAFLTSLIKLKSLKIETSSDVVLTNLDVFYGMPSIEKLDLTSLQQLKSIDFLNNMPKLKSLKLRDCPIIDIEPLRDSVVLTDLSLSYLNSLNDISVLPTIKNLRNLELSYVDVDEKAMPNLTGLALLNTLTIDSEYSKAIFDMKQLKTLKLLGSYPLDKDLIASLTGLKKFEIALKDNDVEINSAIAKLPNLEDLTINFVLNNVYEFDPIFASNSITSLTIVNSDLYNEELKVDFDNMLDNTVLKKFSISDIDMIDAKSKDENQEGKLGQYTDQFFKHFGALEELNISKNQIMNLDFVSYLPNLRVLDISDNYVTDITPLLNCKNLEVLKCGNNNITNLNLLPENVRVFSSESQGL